MNLYLDTGQKKISQKTQTQPMDMINYSKVGYYMEISLGQLWQLVIRKGKNHIAIAEDLIFKTKKGVLEGMTLNGMMVKVLILLG